MVDVSKLSEKKKKVKTSNFGRVFLFALLGAMLGAFIFLGVHIVFSVVAGFLYLLCGAGAYAFYLYFVDDEDRNKKDIIFMIIACFIAVIVSYFFDVMINYSNQMTDETLNLFQKTIEYYKLHISVNGLSNTDDSISLIFIQIMYFAFSIIGLFVSKLFIRTSVKSWNKKHGNEQPSEGYGHRSRKKRAKKR